MKMKKVLLALAATLCLTNASAQTEWDFSNITDADQTNLNADATNWTYDSTNDRWGNATTFTQQELTANGNTLAVTKGLYFTATKADNIRIDNKKGCVTLNNKAATITIKNLTAGTALKVVCKSSSKTTARSVTASNVTVTSWSEAATSETTQTNTGTVTADGDVTLSVDGGMYFYSITVGSDEEEVPGGDDSGDTGGDSGSTTDNSVSANAANNQVELTLKAGGTKYYNTADLTSGVTIDGAKISINGDTYDGTVSKMAFNKASEGNAGTFTNEDGKVTITEAKGWFEAAYVKFTYADADSFVVYVKGAQYSDYTKIDDQLIRKYSDCYRADVVGLRAASDIALKVVPVVDGAEKESAANEATAITAAAYDRGGFAHFNFTEGIGAYNNDGTLKEGAKVLYVTAETAKTISTEVITNKKGTTTVCTGWQAIIDAYQKGLDTTPITFRIIGTVSADDVDSFSSSAEGLQIKGKNSYSTLNITIEGIGEDAVTTGYGFLIRNAKSVELRNFANMLCMDDAVSIDTDNSNIWVHNLDLFYGNTGGASDQAKGDGTIDIKGDSKYITLYNNHLWDTGKSSLCGMTSETGENWITYHHNWFDHSDSRHPRIRTMSVHVYNNYFDGVSKYGIGAAKDCRGAFVEANYFRNCKYPMLISKQGTDVYYDSKGTFSGETGGVIKAYNNYMTGQKRFQPWTSSAGTDWDAYVATSRDEQVPSSVTASGNSYNNFDTDKSLMYEYEVDEPADVPSKVTGWLGAGRMNHGDFQWTFNNSTEDSNYAVITALKSALQNYSNSSLVKIYGTGSASTEKGTSGSETGGSESGSETGGSESGSETGGSESGSTTTTGAATISWPNKDVTPSDSRVTATVLKQYSSDQTYNGNTYKYGAKLNSKGSITMTLEAQYNVTFVQGTDKTYDKGLTITDANGTTYESTLTDNVVTATLPAGTYTITNAGKETSVFLIILE